MEIEVQTDLSATLPLSRTPPPTLFTSVISLQHKAQMVALRSRAFPLRSPRTVLLRFQASPKRFRQRSGEGGEIRLTSRHMSVTPQPVHGASLPSPTSTRSPHSSVKLPLLEKIPRRLTRKRKEVEWKWSTIDRYFI